MGEPRRSEMKKAVYGPVPSWRLGRSLGIDLISRPKTCSFDCIYCQLGPTRHRTRRREEFVPTRRVLAELAALPPVEVDFVTLSGMGEPTLASNLGEVIAAVSARLERPVAVLTNSSLLGDPQVRAELAPAQLVAAKLDAPDEDLFREINRPEAGARLEPLLQGLRRFREEYRGRLAIQIMFCARNRDRAAEMASLIASLSPDEVQLNTPLRPSPTPPLSAAEMEHVKRAFAGLPAAMIYDADQVKVEALDPAQTAPRRPLTSNHVERMR